MKFIIFGLGNFGRALAIKLTELGHEAIGVDKSMSKIEPLREKITHAVCLDSTNIEAVSGLPLNDADAVIVAIGEDEAASLLTTALLKQLKVKRIIGRIVSDLQRIVLEAMHLDEFILPEHESAERLALRLDSVGVVDSFKLSEKYSVVETLAPYKYWGKTLGDTDLTNEYKVLVLSTIHVERLVDGNSTKTVTGIATGDTVVSQGDILVLFGAIDDIKRFIRKNQ